MSEQFVLRDRGDGTEIYYCTRCKSGNGADLDALKAACERNCHVLFTDAHGGTMTAVEMLQAHEERGEG